MPVQGSLTFYKGVKDGMPIAFGYIPVSFAFGILALDKGFPSWSPVLISVTSFTGTGQFAGINLMAEGTALFELAFTLLIINLRYMLMSLSLSQKLSPTISLWQRILIGFGNTDEVYAVSMRQRELLNFHYMGGMILTAYAGWIIGTVAGGFACTALPASVGSALGIAIYAMFVAIIIPAAKRSRPVVYVVLTGILLSCIFQWVPVFHPVGKGWVIIICGIVSSVVGAWFFPIREEADEK